jgi:hypothetical protein
MRFSGSTGVPSVCSKAEDKSNGDSDESALILGYEPDDSTSSQLLVTEMALDYEDEPNGIHLATEMTVDSDNDTRPVASLGHFKPVGAPESSAGGTSQAVLTETTVLDSDDVDTMTLASLAHVKPAGKRSLYKYNYNGFMQDCTKLATAVQNRPHFAEAVHGTIVTLLRIAQGQESEIDKKLFIRSSKAPTQHLEQNGEFIQV